jgi:cytochrome P450 family 150 subfamily A5
MSDIESKDFFRDDELVGPAENRRYDYVPTFILRGLTELHVEFTL